MHRWIAKTSGALSIFVALAVCVITGCSNRQPASEDNTWTITELRADHGHDTLESEDGGMYHNYFCAIVLKDDNKTLNLLYENQLPGNIELQVGDQCRIDGLDTAEYSDNWRGYWLHDVRLIAVPRN